MGNAPAAVIIAAAFFIEDVYGIRFKNECDDTYIYNMCEQVQISKQKYSVNVSGP